MNSRSFGARLAASSFAALCFCMAAGELRAASPVLSNIRPQGLQRGTELELAFNGDRLDDAKEILFYTPGCSVQKLTVVNRNLVKVRIKAAADARLGEHAVRVRTASGLSELRTFYVSQFPAVDEKEPNSEFAAAQKVAMNVTVQGGIGGEDVDYYRVVAKKGQRISAEVEAMRLANSFFDPSIAIYDSKRFVLGSNDDATLLNQDSTVSVIAPQDGEYVVEVREASYGGGDVYRLHIGSFPRPLAVFPAGGKAGEEVDFKFIGVAGGAFRQKIRLPAKAADRFPLFAEQNGQSAPSPNYVRVSDFPNVMEVEPNDDPAHATKVDVALPAAFNGIIEKPGDQDFYRFKAKQGEVYDVHVYARRLRSPLDPVLHLYFGDGRYITGNDDAVGPDSYIRFTAPATGEFLAMVHDHRKQGGEDFVYRIEFQKVAPKLTMSIPEFVQYQQERRAVVVPRGNRMVSLAIGNRADWGGELEVGAEGLPEGVTLKSEKMHPGLNQTPVVFEASAAAPVAGRLADFTGKAADPKTKVSGTFDQSISLLFGPPNQTPYWTYNADKLAVAVAEEAPFSVRIVEPKAPLVQDGSINLKVVAERKAGFKGPITIVNVFNPPGVGSVPSVVIPDGKNEVMYPFNANRGAELRSWKFAFAAVGDAGKGPVWVSTQLCPLRIAAPYAELSLQMAAGEQGKPTEVVCKVDQKTPFVGKAKVTLVGMPAGVSAPPLEMTKEIKELVFKVTLDKGSPAGQHKTLFCQVTVQESGEEVFHNLGYGGTLRIDPPPPPKKVEPAKPAAVAAAKPQPAPAAPAQAKRLTRLEQLRLEQAERAKAAASK